jgi:hypothetical protein
VHPLNGVRSGAAFRLLPRSRRVGRRRIDRDGAGHATLQELEREGTDAGTDVEQVPVQRARLCEAVHEQARGGSWPSLVIARQLRSGLLLAELLFGRVLERRATG